MASILRSLKREKSRRISYGALLGLIIGLSLAGAACQDRAGRIYSRALKLAQQKKYEQAVQEMRRLLQLAPRSSKAHNALAQIYRAQNLYSQAIEELEKALEVNSTDPIPAYNLGTIYREMEDFPRSAEFFQEALKRDPRFSPALYRLGTLSLDRGDWEGAKQHLSVFLENEPLNAWGHNNLGVLFWKTGEPDLARGEFEKTVELEPNLAAGWFNLGISSLPGGGKEAAAAGALNRYLKLKPFAPEGAAIRRILDRLAAAAAAESRKPSPQGYLQAGVKFEAAKDYGRAATEYRKAIELDPNGSEAHYRLGRLCDLFLDDKLGAIEEYEKFIERDPKSPRLEPLIVRIKELRGQLGARLLVKKDLPRTPAPEPSPSPAPMVPRAALAPGPEDYYREGQALEGSGRQPEALAAYQKAVALDRNHAASLFRIGRIQASQGKYPQALEAFKQAQAVDDSLPTRDEIGAIYLKLGTAAISERKYEQAAGYYREARRYGKTYEADQGQWTSYQAAFRSEFERGDFSAAAGYLRTAVEMRPDNASDCLALGDLYAQKLNRPGEARRYYQKYVALVPRGPDADRVKSYLTPSARVTTAPVRRVEAKETPASFGSALECFNRGAVYQRQQKLAEAEKEYQRAVSLDSGYYQAYYNLGVLYNQTGRSQNALSAFKKVIQIKPDFAPAHLALFNLYYYRFPMKNLAREHARKYIQFEPNSPQARALREWLSK